MYTSISPGAANFYISNEQNKSQKIIFDSFNKNIYTYYILIGTPYVSYLIIYFISFYIGEYLLVYSC